MKKVEIKIPTWLAKKNSISQILVGSIEAETEKAILFDAEDITYKGWLPKSQIEVIKELRQTDKSLKAKIGLHTKTLSDGTVKVKGIAIKSQYEHKNLCLEVKKEFGGKWNAERYCWQYPLQVDVVDYAKKVWRENSEKLEFSKACKEWYDKRKLKQEQLISAKARNDVKASELATTLSDTLYDYQRVGVHFLSQCHGAILADDMGLGKTIQSLATIDEIGAKKALIVCPASVKLNWGDEVEKWLPNKRYTILSGSKKDKLEAIQSNDYDIYITNYAALREKSRKKVNGKWTKVENLIFKEIQKKGFDVVVLDEAHRIKNRKSQQTKALHKIAKKAAKTYHLTGTPIVNKPSDLWSLLHTIDPKKFSSFWRFVNRHCEIWDNGFGKEIGGVKNPKKFREVLKAYMIRRVKEEVIDDMPELLTKKHWVELEGKQAKIYNQMEQDMVAEIGEEQIAAPIVISKILRLKQIAVSPSLINDSSKVKSAKIKALFDILDGAGEQKVVVFTQFQKAAELVANKLNKEGIDYGLLHGGIDTDTRHRDVKRFQNDPDCRVFIATIKAGGVGINLTKGSIAVFLDKDWTTANNNQAIDRLHRIGQKNNVTVIELLAKNTIEEYIEELLEDKQKTFDSLIEEKMTGKELLVNLKDRMNN